jgi:hypothetical protein
MFIRGRSAVLSVLWVGVALWVIWADSMSGLPPLFPVTYLVPVILAANSGCFSIALLLSFVMPLARLQGHDGLNDNPQVWANALIHCFVLAFIAMLVYRQQREVKVLRGILRVCSFCKRIKSGEETWQPIESYVTRHADVRFSHTFCPECARAHYPEFFREPQTPTAAPLSDARLTVEA